MSLDEKFNDSGYCDKTSRFWRMMARSFVRCAANVKPERLDAAGKHLLPNRSDTIKALYWQAMADRLRAPC